MGRAPCCKKIEVRKGRWTEEEDELLKNYIHEHGEGSWSSVPEYAGLKRCGKSCRLRWVNYLKTDIKRGKFSAEEDALIVDYYNYFGSRWAFIAEQLPGRTDNEIKNHWTTRLSRSINSFRKTIDEIPTSVLEKMIDWSERRGIGIGRAGRRKARNKKIVEETNNQTRAEILRDKVEDGNGEGTSTTLLPVQVKTITTTIVDQIQELRNMDSGVKSKENDSHLQGPCHDIEGIVQDGDSENSFEIAFSPEKGNGLLRPYEDLWNDITFPADHIMSDEVVNANVIPGPSEGKLEGICSDWDIDDQNSYSSMNSYLEDEWINSLWETMMFQCDPALF